MSRADFTRADTPSPGSRSPLLDLSVVKPMTASCVSSPVPQEMPGEAGPQSSPVPGPSGVQQRARSIRPRSVSFGDQRSVGTHIQDSLLSANMTKTDPETVYRRESSRISTASYSSFTLNYLQSPRLKSTENPGAGGDNQQSLDGFDQNFFISLNTLQANQIDDLENVLLPHLGMDGRSEGALFDDVGSTDADHDISTTSPETGDTTSHDISFQESQEQPDADNQEGGSDGEDNSGDNTVNICLSTSVNDTPSKTNKVQQMQPASPEKSDKQNDFEPLNCSIPTESGNISLQEDPKIMPAGRELGIKISESQGTLRLEETQALTQPKPGSSSELKISDNDNNSNQEQIQNQNESHDSLIPTFPMTNALSSSPPKVSEPLSLTCPTNPPPPKRLKLTTPGPPAPLTSQSVSPSPMYQGNSPRSHDNLSITSPIHYTKSVTPVRMTPNTSSRDMATTPIRLMPQVDTIKF